MTEGKVTFIPLPNSCSGLFCTGNSCCLKLPQREKLRGLNST